MNIRGTCPRPECEGEAGPLGVAHVPLARCYRCGAVFPQAHPAAVLYPSPAGRGPALAAWAMAFELLGKCSGCGAPANMGAFCPGCFSRVGGSVAVMKARSVQP